MKGAVVHWTVTSKVGTTCHEAEPPLVNSIYWALAKAKAWVSFSVMTLVTVLVAPAPNDDAVVKLVLNTPVFLKLLVVDENWVLVKSTLILSPSISPNRRCVNLFYLQLILSKSLSQLKLLPINNRYC